MVKSISVVAGDWPAATITISLAEYNHLKSIQVPENVIEVFFKELVSGLINAHGERIDKLRFMNMLHANANMYGYTIDIVKRENTGHVTKDDVIIKVKPS